MYDASEVSGATERMYSIYIYINKYQYPNNEIFTANLNGFFFEESGNGERVLFHPFQSWSRGYLFGGIKQFKCMEHLRDFPLIL